MIIDCISDLHGYYPPLNGGDILIVAGDLTMSQDEENYEHFCKWISIQRYEHKIIIAGNHDTFLESNPDYFKDCCHYLCDSGIEIEGLKIWGSPWTTKFPGMNPDCMAFTLDNEFFFPEKWDLIPEDTDILVTHMPPYNILDRVRWYGHIGSVSLRMQTMRINPRLHVFGHIHEHGGQMLENDQTKFVNASIVDERYRLVNKAVRIHLQF